MRKLPLFILITLLIFCEEPKKIVHKSTDGSIKELNNWFTKEANFEKEEYKEKFIQAFKQAIKKKEYKKSTELLLSVFLVMNNRGTFDVEYVEILKNYIKNHKSRVVQDDIFTFYLYLGIYENLNLNHKKCIEILSNVTILEEYNYNTYSIKGEAFYFISYSYFGLGNIEKALEEIEKSYKLYAQTDNYYGQALVNNMKATIYYDTKNDSEAIKSIDKVIAIYKKLNYNEGLARALINKYEFLTSIDIKKANPYLDTIEKFINERKIKDIQTLIHFNFLKTSKYLEEKNIKKLDQIIPEMENQVKKINVSYWENIVEMNKAKYQILKYSKILQKEKLLNILKYYKKNNEISYTNYILKTLKDEAVASNDLKKVLEYESEIDEFEKKMQENDFQFKVKTYEKKIDTERKEKLIAQQKNKLKQSYLFLGALGFVLFIIIIFWRINGIKKKRIKIAEEYKNQQLFTIHLLQNTEEERNRIANELHDSVGHDLLNIKNKLIQNKKISAQEIDIILNEVRAISRNLYPSVLQNLGLQISIENLCEKLTDELGLFTTCEIKYVKKLSQSKELQLYRIIQEALNNTIKHGKANAAKVILNSENDLLYLEIKDNGKGFNFDEKIKNNNSFGLQSILQRAKAIAAKIDITSDSLGTKILLKIPT